MTGPMPKDIEEGDAAHRVIYLRGYQDGYRAAHELRAAGKQPADPAAPLDPDVQRRLVDLESAMRAVQGNNEDQAKEIVELRRRLVPIENDLDGRTKGV